MLTTPTRPPAAESPIESRRPAAPQLGPALRTQQVLALQRSAGNQATVAALNRARGSSLQRRESGSGLDDPLYMENRQGSSGQGPDDRITGRKLHNWAIAAGSAVVRAPFTTERMQQKESGAEYEIVTEIYALLVDLLRGTGSSQSSHAFWGKNHGPYDPNAESALRSISSLSRFTGSENAREQAVMELTDHWGPVESFLTGLLLRQYDDQVLAALGRTPKDWELELDTKEIVRLRTNTLHKHQKVVHQGMAGDFLIGPGWRFAGGSVVDVYLSLGSRSDSPGVVWAVLDGMPQWYYKAGTDQFNRQTVMAAVASDVAQSAKFAALLFPFMLRVGGFALSFAPNPVFIIAGVILDEMGEEGERVLEGKGRSAGEIAGDGAKELIINLVLHKLGGGAGPRAAADLELAAGAAAKKAGGAIRQEIVRTEGAQVAAAVERGDGRLVTDSGLQSEGYVFEVEIEHAGGRHTYRRTKNGKWCRWSVKICDTNPGLGVDKKADEQIGKLSGQEPATAAELAKPTKDAARQLTNADVTKGMEIDPTQVKVFRGGDSFELAPGHYKMGTDGLVQTSHGLSLDISAANPNVASRGAHQVKSIPAELKIIQRGNNISHFEVVPRVKMKEKRYAALLKQIELW